LDAKLKAGTAGDLIACRPFDKSLEIYNAGQLVPLNDLPGMDNFSDVAKGWVASDEFAQPYANALPGFFPLANVKYSLEDPVAQEFVNWRKDNATSFRCSYQILSRNANPNNENDLWNACAQQEREIVLETDKRLGDAGRFLVHG